MGQNQVWDIKNSLSHERGSERSERASERVSAAEGASEASSPQQANEWAVRANERTDERVAQYFSLYFWLIWPTVPPLHLHTSEQSCISLPVPTRVHFYLQRNLPVWNSWFKKSNSLSRRIHFCFYSRSISLSIQMHRRISIRGYVRPFVCP